MVSQTNEQALEATIQKALTGTCLEDFEGGNVVQTPRDNESSSTLFFMGFADDFDPQYAIDTVRFWSFLENTQKEELEKLQRSSDWKLKIIQRLDRMVKKFGLLRILRKGLEVEDAHFTMLYPLPLASSGKTIQENFQRNEFSITRQIRFNTENQRQEIDMVGTQLAHC